MRESKENLELLIKFTMKNFQRQSMQSVLLWRKCNYNEMITSNITHKVLSNNIYQGPQCMCDFSLPQFDECWQKIKY